MSKNYTRKEVKDHLISLKEKEIKALEDSHKIYSDGADLDEETSLKMDDFAQQNQSTESARSLQVRIEQAKENLEAFRTVRPELINEITEGNVVFTDRVNFVIGLAFKEFEWGNKKFIGISTQAPIFQAIVGKRKGDTIEFNGITYTVEDIL
ncbi:hypothetical protein [Faecalibacter rhinopitheci]|uniref:Transcription elongation factor GreA n=1 Tax=Faecalibacter rhinopitheci TaxID=2779678 RepID=A0A8J7KIR1_9FLAO|nr:hypothetical protein [Faecalibacter rhinopitheci]MBF0598251.1 hypothetical protein [Faecalibacter rhinopitheci]